MDGFIDHTGLPFSRIVVMILLEGFYHPRRYWKIKESQKVGLYLPSPF